MTKLYSEVILTCFYLTDKCILRHVLLCYSYSLIPFLFVPFFFSRNLCCVTAFSGLKHSILEGHSLWHWVFQREVENSIIQRSRNSKGKFFNFQKATNMEVFRILTTDQMYKPLLFQVKAPEDTQQRLTLKKRFRQFILPRRCRDHSSYLKETLNCGTPCKYAKVWGFQILWVVTNADMGFSWCISIWVNLALVSNHLPIIL